MVGSQKEGTFHSYQQTFDTDTGSSSSLFHWSSYEYSSLESKLPRKAQGIDLMNATSSTISFFFLGRQARAQVWGYGPISFLSYENGSVNEKHRRQRKGKLQQQKLVSMKTIR